MLGSADVNENTNGLIRQYVPKGTALDTLSQAQIHHIMDRLNHRPRKGLAFQTPHEKRKTPRLILKIGALLHTLNFKRNHYQIFRTGLSIVVNGSIRLGIV